MNKLKNLPLSHIRFLDKDDTQAVYALDKQCNKQPMSPVMINSEIVRPTNICIGSVEDDILLGFLLATTHSDKIHILNLAVTPNARRQGIGTQLIKQLERSIDSGSIITLDVAATNRQAISFYKRNNFNLDKIEPIEIKQHKCIRITKQIMLME